MTLDKTYFVVCGFHDGWEDVVLLTALAEDMRGKKKDNRHNDETPRLDGDSEEGGEGSEDEEFQETEYDSDGEPMKKRSKIRRGEDDEEDFTLMDDWKELEEYA